MCQTDSLAPPQMIVRTKFKTVVRKCEEDACNTANFTVRMLSSLATRGQIFHSPWHTRDSDLDRYR